MLQLTEGGGRVCVSVGGGGGTSLSWSRLQRPFTALSRFLMQMEAHINRK